jgi:zinc-ribbon domain
MAYTSDLGAGQHLTVENQGTQTLVTLNSSTPGQQQSQRSSFETGTWIMTPILLRTAIGLILQLEASQGKTFVLIQGHQVQILPTPPIMTGADILPLHFEPTDTSTAETPMQPMQPMQPMRMGNMEMQMNPMQMRMGNMELRMNSPAATQDASQPEPQSTKRFCPQCGQPVDAGDRFCAHCGHQLT